MEIIGLWVALIGYTVVYAGLANWSGESMSLAQAFTGSTSTSTTTPTKTTASSSAAWSPTTGGPAR